MAEVVETIGEIEVIEETEKRGAIEKKEVTEVTEMTEATEVTEATEAIVKIGLIEVIEAVEVAEAIETDEETSATTKFRETTIIKIVDMKVRINMVIKNTEAKEEKKEVDINQEEDTGVEVVIEIRDHLEKKQTIEIKK